MSVGEYILLVCLFFGRISIARSVCLGLQKRKYWCAGLLKPQKAHELLYSACVVPQTRDGTVGPPLC
jgi:hypothetical protein